MVENGIFAWFQLTEERTDRRTNGPMDTSSHRDARTHLKNPAQLHSLQRVQRHIYYFSELASARIVCIQRFRLFFSKQVQFVMMVEAESKTKPFFSRTVAHTRDAFLIHILHFIKQNWFLEALLDTKIMPLITHCRGAFIFFSSDFSNPLDPRALIRLGSGK